MRSELQSGRVTLHAERSGEGEETLIILHGLFGSASNLAGLARSLEAQFQIIRLDLRNHGKSAHSEFMDIPRMAGDVLGFLDEHQLAKVHLLGHSLGGKVAMQLALNHPERVAKLVVADIAPVRYGRGHDAILDGMLAIDLRSLESREQADRQLAHYVEELPVRQFLLKNLARDSDGGWRWKMNLAAIAEHYDLLRDAPEGDVFGGPSLFIKGEQSRYIIDDNRVGIQRLFPDAQLRVIEQAGHWLHAEQPQKFNDLVARFLLDRSGNEL